LQGKVEPAIMEHLKWELEVIEKKNEDRFRQIENIVNR
jgi:hypothetical protein